MYTIKKKDKNFKAALIEKKYEETVTFTVEQIDKHVELLERAVREIEGKKQISEAKIQNVLNNHPEVKKMDGVKIIAVHLFHENTAIVKEAEMKLKEVKKQLAEYKKERKEIYEALGFKDEKETRN